MKILELFLLITVNIVLTIAGTVYRVNSESYLEIRKNANIDSAVVGSLKKNDYIYATSESNGWAKFYKGYCDTKYLEKVAISPNYKTTTSLIFRTGPSNTYGIITTLSNGSLVTYYGRDPFTTNWGVTENGYCNMNYITPKGISSTSSTEHTSKSGRIIHTTSPLKQYNYSGEYSPGCTIKKYGSCITSITMVLNHFENKNYKPLDVAEKMSFKNCSIYQSSFNNLNFKFMYSPTLQIVLNAIRAGRMVPFGAKDSKDAQHWVVVHGYVGNYKTLQSSDFLIYDPSYSRTRLSEHLEAFPIPYLALIYN